MANKYTKFLMKKLDFEQESHVIECIHLTKENIDEQFNISTEVLFSYLQETPKEQYKLIDIIQEKGILEKCCYISEADASTLRLKLNKTTDKDFINLFELELTKHS